MFDWLGFAGEDILLGWSIPCEVLALIMAWYLNYMDKMVNYNGG